MPAWSSDPGRRATQAAWATWTPGPPGRLGHLDAWATRSLGAGLAAVALAQATAWPASDPGRATQAERSAATWPRPPGRLGHPIAWSRPPGAGLEPAGDPGRCSPGRCSPGPGRAILATWPPGRRATQAEPEPSRSRPSRSRPSRQPAADGLQPAARRRPNCSRTAPPKLPATAAPTIHRSHLYGTRPTNAPPPPQFFATPAPIFYLPAPIFCHPRPIFSCPAPISRQSRNIFSPVTQ